ncbi:MAG: DUF11 domain-containing protein [Verrucomicrobia bacterium]|nr:DUF11 domain-containing protein [Verrucomicrobiota bacterium]
MTNKLFHSFMVGCCSGLIRAIVVVSFVVAIASLQPAWGQAAGRFVWTERPDNIRVGRPFHARLEARREDGQVATEQAIRVWLSAVTAESSPGLVISELSLADANVELTHVGRDAVDLSGWRVHLYDSVADNSPRTSFEFPKQTFCQPGDVIQLQVRSPPLTPTRYPTFRFSGQLEWRRDSLAAVLLVDGSGLPIDFFVTGLDIRAIQEPFQINPALWSGPPVSNAYVRNGAYNHRRATDWSFGPPSMGRLNNGLTVPFARGESSRALSPDSVTLTNGVWSGPLSLPEDATEVRLRADNRLGLTGDTAAIRVLPRLALRILIPDVVAESESAPVAGQVAIPEPLPQATVIELNSSAPQEIQVPSRLTIPAGQTNAFFNLLSKDDTLLDGSPFVTITAFAPELTSAEARVQQLDSELAVLTLTLPPSLNEGEPALEAVLRIDRPPERDARVQLMADVANRIEFPAEILLPAGQTAAAFQVRARDDEHLNGDQQVALKAEVRSWTAAVGSILVRDNEKPELRLVLPSPVLEGTFLTNSARLELGGATLTNLSVRLSSEPPTGLFFPKNPLIVPAGQSSIAFDFQSQDNILRDGARSARVMATALGFVPGIFEVRIHDNEMHALQFDPLPLSAASGEALAVRVVAVDDEGRRLANRADLLEFSAGTGLLVVDAPPPLRLTNGVWSGAVKLSGAAGSIQLEASSGGSLSTNHPLLLKPPSFRRVSLQQKSMTQERPEMIYDPGTKRLYLLDSTSGLARVDPVTGVIESMAGIRGGRHLVRTDGGEFLYWVAVESNATQVIRFDLNTSRWTNFALPYGVASLQTVPGFPRRFVAATSRWLPGNPFLSGIYAFEDGQFLPRSAAFTHGQSYTALVFTRTNIVYGYEGHVTSYRFVRHRVHDDGVEFIDVPYHVEGAGALDLQTHAGLVFGLSGAYDPDGGRTMARLPFSARPWLHLPSRQLVVIEPAKPPVLRGFDIETFAPTGSAALPEEIDPNADVAFWDAGGVAALGSGSLWLLEPAFLGTNAVPDLALQLEDRPEPARVNQPLTLRLLVANRGGIRARRVLLRYTLPGGADLAEGSLGGSAERFGDVVVFNLSDLEPGATRAVEIQLIPRRAKPLLHRAETATLDTERSYQDNRAVEETAVADESPIVARFAFHAGDLVWDARRQRLYASVNDDAHPLNGWLAALNLDAQSLSGLLRVGTLPGRMAISDDARFLYVATEEEYRVKRVDLETGQIDLAIDLERHVGELGDMAPVPGRPRSIAITGGYSGTGTIFDDGVPRSVTPLGGPLVRAGESADVIYAFTSKRIPGVLTRLYWPPESQPTGIAVANALPEIEVDFSSDHGLLLSAAGWVVEGRTLSVLGNFAEVYSNPRTDRQSRPRQRLASDLRNNRAYYLQQTPESFTRSVAPVTATLRAFSINDFKHLGSVGLRSLNGYPESLSLCAEGKLAFRTLGGQVVVLEAPFRNTHSPANLVVTQPEPAGPATVGDPIIYRVAVTNRGPEIARNVVLRNAWSEGAEFLSATLSDGEWRREGRVIESQLNDLPPGTGRELILKVIARTNAEISHSALALASNPDPVANDNRSQTAVSTGLSRLLSLEANDLTYDAVGARLLVSVGPRSGAWSNSIVSVNPADGRTQFLVRLSGEPTVVAVSDDGQFLYAGIAEASEVQRVNLKSNAVDLKISLRQPGEVVSASPTSLVSVPGSPETLLASIRGQAAVFDRDQPRPLMVGSYQLALGNDAATFYQTHLNTFRRLRLATNGLIVAQEMQPRLPPNSDMRFAWQRDRAVFRTGHLIDTRDGSQLGRFPIDEGTVFGQRPIFGPGLPDLERGRVLFLSSPDQPWFFPGAILRAFAPETFLELWSVAVPNVRFVPGQAVAAGPGRLAFIAYCTRPGFTCPGSELVLVNLGAVPELTSADLALTSSATVTNITQGGWLTCQQSVVNYGPWAVDGVELEMPIPQGLFFDKARIGQGQIVRSNEVLLVRLGRLASYRGATVEVTLRAIKEGPQSLRAMVRHTGIELAPENDAASLAFQVEAPPWISLEDITVPEGFYRSSPRLTLSHRASEPVTVMAVARSGSALAGEDFAFPPTATVTVPPGSTSAFLPLTVLNDTLVEGPEDFRIELTSASHGFLARREAVVTIADDDAYRFSVRGGGQIIEGNFGVTNLAFEVGLTPPARIPLSVDYLTGAGTATQDKDYLPKGGRLVFAPGVTNLTLAVPVLGDLEYEPDESFALVLTVTDGGELAVPSALGWIRNDDTPVAPTILGLRLSPEQVAIRFSAVPGLRYQLEWRPSLSEGVWTAATPVTTATENQMEVSHPPRTTQSEGRAFYRVVLVP